MQMCSLIDAFDSSSSAVVHIPDKFRYLFRGFTCDVCGSPLEVSETLSVVKCSNINCPIKLSKSLVKVMDGLRIKGLGEATISNHIKEHNLRCSAYKLLASEMDAAGIDLSDVAEKMKDSPYSQWREIIPQDKLDKLSKIVTKVELQATNFLDVLRVVVSGKEITPIKCRLDFLQQPPPNFADSIREALSVRRTYTEAIKIMHFPDIVERADSIFGRCDCYDDYLNKIAGFGGFSKFVQKTMIKKNDSILKSRLLVKIIYHSDELRRIPEVFNIRHDASTVLNLVITGSILKVDCSTKLEYVEYLNEKLEGKDIRLNLQHRVTQMTNILVSDSENTTNYRNAIEINEHRIADGNNNLIIICDSAELLYNAELIAAEDSGKGGVNE